MATEAVDTTPKKKKKTVLIIVIVLVVLVLVGGGLFALRMLQHKQAAASGMPGYTQNQNTTEEPDAEPDDKISNKRAPGEAPFFTAPENFTANLSDGDRDRFAQTSIVIELANKELEQSVKNVMPIIRSRVLLLLSSKTASDLLTLDGKKQFAAQVLEIAKQEVGKPHRDGVYGVHFSNFVIQ